jgi:hypothetical protein
MKTMSSSPVEPPDLLDLKLLPAWVKEPAAPSYEHYTGEEGERPAHGRRSPRNKRGRKFKESAFNSDKSRASAQRPTFNKGSPREFGRVGRDSERVRERGRQGRRPGHPRQDPAKQNRAHEDRRSPSRPPSITPAPLEITIRFLPYSRVFENVVAQIKSGSVAYSLFALARLFLEKPGRYEVRLTAKAGSPLYQLGENGVVSVNREFLERNAFRLVQEDFYKIDITQSDPIQGNFSNVARCRLSGTLLGPTNHHNYQPQLRSLYEQRFSRRMSFADYQRQIEIVNDPALIEKWKEQARMVTTFTTLNGESSSTFSSAMEAERHFRSNYLPDLLRNVDEATIGGVLSRRLIDRTLNRAIEDAWTRENRSPSNMMQELAGRFRHEAVNVFRHRRGMLFVSPIRVRPFVHAQAEVSSSVNAILETLAAAPGTTNRKEIFEKLPAAVTSEEIESRKLALASDLRWLINEGYVIEFNDGSLDLPRVKVKQQEVVAAAEPALPARRDEGLPNGSTAERIEPALATANAEISAAELEIGGS